MNNPDDVINLPNGESKPYGELTVFDLQTLAKRDSATRDMLERVIGIHGRALEMLQESGATSLDELAQQRTTQGLNAGLLAAELADAERRLRWRIPNKLPDRADA